MSPRENPYQPAQSKITRQRVKSTVAVKRCFYVFAALMCLCLAVMVFLRLRYPGLTDPSAGPASAWPQDAFDSLLPFVILFATFALSPLLAVVVVSQFQRHNPQELFTGCDASHPYAPPGAYRGNPGASDSQSGRSGTVFLIGLMCAFLSAITAFLAVELFSGAGDFTEIIAVAVAAIAAVLGGVAGLLAGAMYCLGRGK